MDPADLAAAAAALQGKSPSDAAAQVLALLDAGSAPGLGPYLALGARMDRVFLLAPPLAAGAVMCGASFRPLRGGPFAHVAGLGRHPRAAFLRAMSEAAEALALAQARAHNAAALATVDLAQHPCGTVPAGPVLADGAGLAAGDAPEAAARNAALEAVERHALALWVSGAEVAGALSVPAAVRAYEASLRGPRRAAPLDYLLLPCGFDGISVVAAVSLALPQGPCAGYGCAPDPAKACAKAAREAVLAETGLLLEDRAASDGVAPAPAGFLARAAWFAARPDLIAPMHKADWPVAGSAQPQDLDRCLGGSVFLADLTMPDTPIRVFKAVAPQLARLSDVVAPGCPGPL